MNNLSFALFPQLYPVLHWPLPIFVVMERSNLFAGQSLLSPSSRPTLKAMPSGNMRNAYPSPEDYAHSAAKWGGPGEGEITTLLSLFTISRSSFPIAAHADDRQKRRQQRGLATQITKK